MKETHYLWFLIWVIPAWLLFLLVHQGDVLIGLNKTFQNGTSYVAEVDEFRIKQIAAQTNGYIVVRFTPHEGYEVVQKLSQPIQNAAQLMASELLPIRYLPESSQPIVITTIYEFHRNMVRANLAILSIAFLVMFGISVLTTRFARKKLAGEISEPTFELVEESP